VPTGGETGRHVHVGALDERQAAEHWIG
jgi:hypothetical protein